MLQSLFGRNPAARQIAIVGVGLAVTALVFGVSRWAGKPVMTPLLSGLELSNVGTVTDKLTELAITSEVSQSGTTILVPEADIVRARVALAREAMPGAGRPGMEIFDKATWGLTDFTQKVNFGRALEGELERTIGSMRGVSSVKVHLALQDESLFEKNARKSTASVVLAMDGGQAPQASAVAGIASMVAHAVGGLEASHVMISDDQGKSLTIDDDGSVAGLTSRQLSIQHEIETDLVKKAETLVENLVGPGNVHAQVTATINFDKLDRTTQSVDPEKQAASTEQRSEVTPGTPQQGAGYSTVATSFENTRSVENFSSAVGNLQKISVSVLIADKVTIPAADSATGAVAAPVVTPRTPEEVARIESLVRDALGVDSLRGDRLTVSSQPFFIPAPIAKAIPEPAPGMVDKLTTNPKPFVGAGALMVLLIIGIVLIGALKPKKSSAKGTQLKASPQYPELPASTGMSQAQQPTLAQQEQYALEEQRRTVVLPPLSTTPEREQAIATVDQRPEAAVRVVRNWLRA